MAQLASMAAVWVSCALLGASLPSLRGRRLVVAAALALVVVTATIHGVILGGGF